MTETEYPTSFNMTGYPTSSDMMGNSTFAPTDNPTDSPTISYIPSFAPIIKLSAKPSYTHKPTYLIPTKSPTYVNMTQSPSSVPSSGQPTTTPTIAFSVSPSDTPTMISSVSPSVFPSHVPTPVISEFPSNIPTPVISEFPSTLSSIPPSNIPTYVPSLRPSNSPSTTSLPSTLSPTISTQPSLSNAPSRAPITEAVRVDDIARAIAQISNVADEESCQYKSMQWIMYDDIIDPPLFYDDFDLFQRFSLKTVHCSLNGTSWKKNTAWGSNSSTCDWFGISCDSSGYITDVDLNKNALSGDFPSEFGLLTSLEKLDISANSLKRYIPESLGSLVNLLDLNVAKNQISGELPDDFGLFKNLKSLSIYSNDISGVMLPSICNLDLDYLAADCNKVYCNCCTDCCDTEECDATNSPTESFQLVETAAPTGSSTSIIASVPSGSPTVEAVFVIPTITSVPTVNTASISPSTSISPSEHVFLPTSSMSPVTLSPSAIDAITLNITSISDISDTTSSQYEALQWILNDTYYSSDLDVYQRYALMSMYYSLNGTSWTNNNKWGTSATECNWFGIKCNDDGNIFELILQSNILSGEIPSEIGLLTTLEKIDLSSNSITGNMTINVTSLDKLNFLDVGSNFLEGTIPHEIVSVTSLETLVLEDNMFSGSIIDSFGQLVNLSILKVSINILTGYIPDSLGNLSKFDIFTLNDNYFSGSIPQSICDIKITSLQADCNEIACSCCTTCCKEVSGCVSYDDFWDEDTDDNMYSYY